MRKSRLLLILLMIFIFGIGLNYFVYYSNGKIMPIYSNNLSLNDNNHKIFSHFSEVKYAILTDIFLGLSLGDLLMFSSLVLFILIGIFKKNDYFWKDKEGNKLNFKEFINRWKKGIEKITPEQQIKSQLNSTMIILIGIVAGFIVSLFNFKNFWWGSIILLGAFGNTIIQYVSLYQKKKAFENLDNFINLEEIKKKISEGEK